MPMLNRSLPAPECVRTCSARSISCPPKIHRRKHSRHRRKHPHLPLIFLFLLRFLPTPLPRGHRTPSSIAHPSIPSYPLTRLISIRLPFEHPPSLAMTDIAPHPLEPSHTGQSDRSFTSSTGHQEPVLSRRSSVINATINTETIGVPHQREQGELIGADGSRPRMHKRSLTGESPSEAREGEGIDVDLVSPSSRRVVLPFLLLPTLLICRIPIMRPFTSTSILSFYAFSSFIFCLARHSITSTCPVLKGPTSQTLSNPPLVNGR